MFEIKNCILTAPGVEIHIPTGCHIQDESGEAFENGITVYSHDEAYRMIWQINDYDEGDTEEGLRSLVEEIQPSGKVWPIQPLIVNGLSGHCVAYQTSRNGNFEARFALPDDQQIYFIIITEKCLSIEELMQKQEFKDALNSVHKAD